MGLDVNGSDAVDILYNGSGIAKVTFNSTDVWNQASFGVSGISSPDTVDEGVQFTVSATVTNNGDETDTKTVEYLLDGSTQSSKSISLAGGDSTTVSFDDTINNAGDYTLKISSPDGSDSKSITVETARSTQTYNYTGSKQTHDVSGINETVTIRVTAAGGGNSADDGGNQDTSGGVGSVKEFDVDLSPYDTLDLYVGGAGEDGTSAYGDSTTPASGGWGYNNGGEGGTWGNTKGGGGGGSTEIWSAGGTHIYQGGAGGGGGTDEWTNSATGDTDSSGGGGGGGGGTGGSSQSGSYDGADGEGSGDGGYGGDGGTGSGGQSGGDGGQTVFDGSITSDNGTNGGDGQIDLFV